MKSKKLFLVLAALCTSAQVLAFSGGVTTYDKPTPTTVQRTVKSTAIAGAERDATYQRTMRTAQTAAAASKAVRGIVKTFAAIGTLVTLYEFAKDIKGIWQKDANGDNVLLAPNQLVCSVAPCYAYQPSEGPVSQFPNPEGACRAIVSYRASIYGGRFAYSGVNAATNQCQMNDVYYGGLYGAAIDKVEVAPQTPTPVKLTDAEIEDQIAKSARLPQILDELDKKGMPIDFPDPEVEDMPQPIPLTPSVTTHPDGSKTITQTTLEPFTGPDGKTINWRKNEKTTEVSPPDANGNTTSKVTDKNTDTGQSKVEKGPEPPATDSALPDQPKLYTKKYPDGMTGVWRDQRSAMANSPLFTLPRLLMPSSIGSSGACPSMPVNLSFSTWANFGVKDVAPPCYVWDWARAICIVGACLLARRLIFGG